MDIRNVTVVGAGTMGNGIAHVLAQHGIDVALHDLSQQLLDKAIAVISTNLDRQVKKGTITEEGKRSTLGRITPSRELQLASAGADVVIEAATEDRKVKEQIFNILDALLRPVSKHNKIRQNSHLRKIL